MGLSPHQRLALIGTGVILFLLEFSSTKSQDDREKWWCPRENIEHVPSCNTTAANNTCRTDLNLICMDNGQCGCESKFLWSSERCYCTIRTMDPDHGCEISRHCTEGAKCYHRCPRDRSCPGECHCCEGDIEGQSDGTCPLGPSDCSLAVDSKFVGVDLILVICMGVIFITTM